jgi:predicted DNA binding CopG/RHH family protein
VLEIPFEWDADKVRHVKQHRVTPDEFEQVVVGDPVESTMNQKRVVPVFKSEAEEANWWSKNRKTFDKDLVDRGTLRARLAASKARVISIRLPEEDLALARRQAGQKGLPYQTYIKSLLHQALRQTR